MIKWWDDNEYNNADGSDNDSIKDNDLWDDDENNDADSSDNDSIIERLGVTTIERLDQGHLYPLGRRRDKHVMGGARTSALLQSRQTLYLKSYLDSL